MKAIQYIIFSVFFLSGCKTKATKIVSTYPNGQNKIVYAYSEKNDTLNFTVTQFYKSGKILFNSEVREGKFVGVKTLYWENGRIKRIETLNTPVELIDHNYDCEISNYAENGMIESKYSYKNGKVDGRKIIYDSIGKISQEDSYREGKLNGQEIMYYPNGKIKTYTICRNDSSIGFEYDFDEKGDTIKALVHYGMSVDGIFFKKWLSNGLILTGGYGDDKRTFIIWKWIDKGNKEVKRLIDKGNKVDDYTRFITPK
jgi:antitoxin component YwqK of YwqJK toxin-antitoxin module